MCKAHRASQWQTQQMQCGIGILTLAGDSADAAWLGSSFSHGSDWAAASSASLACSSDWRSALIFAACNCLSSALAAAICRASSARAAASCPTSEHCRESRLLSQQG